MYSPTPSLRLLDIIAPIIVSAIFVALTSLLKEPTRHQCTHDRRCWFRLLWRKLPLLGGWLRSVLSVARLPVTDELQLRWHRMDVACGLGHSAPSLWSTHPPVYPALLFWLCDLRHRYCRLVLPWSSVNLEKNSRPAYHGTVFVMRKVPTGIVTTALFGTVSELVRTL